MGIIDTLVGFGVVVSFFYILYVLISKKHPKINTWVKDLFPRNKPKKEPKEIRQQTWKDNRSMI